MLHIFVFFFFIHIRSSFDNNNNYYYKRSRRLRSRLDRSIYFTIVYNIVTKRRPGSRKPAVDADGQRRRSFFLQTGKKKKLKNHNNIFFVVFYSICFICRYYSVTGHRDGVASGRRVIIIVRFLCAPDGRTARRTRYDSRPSE